MLLLLLCWVGERGVGSGRVGSERVARDGGGIGVLREKEVARR